MTPDPSDTLASAQSDRADLYDEIVDLENAPVYCGAGSRYADLRQQLEQLDEVIGRIMASMVAEGLEEPQP